MKGDFSRFTYRRERHYNGVRMQQGRVQVDADWNEQVDILAHLRRTQGIDVIGGNGAPRLGGGFRIGADGANLSISAGRMYVDGILVENEALVWYAPGEDPDDQPGQPHYPLPADAPVPENGRYIVYLDVWERHITALEDDAIREVALGGPDTATRTQAIWQVRLLPTGEEVLTCWDNPPAWSGFVARRKGRMSARAKPAETATGPCVVPASAGFRGLENQLYRVEIHKRGRAGTATFKWSRDNGMVVTRLSEVDGVILTVADAGRDAVLGFAPGQWIEVSDDEHVLRGEDLPLSIPAPSPGHMVRIRTVVENTIEIESWDPDALARVDAPPDDLSLETATVRRWDHSGPSPAIEVQTGSETSSVWTDLEDGVQVRFHGGGDYETGDYWLIPARTVSADAVGGDIEWPRDPDHPQISLDLAPHGIPHHFARLAIVAWNGTAYTVEHDCRPLFPALIEPDLFYVSGDGQEAMPGEQLPQPLRVAVTNCHRPIEGAWVKFEILEGGGTLELARSEDPVPVVPGATPPGFKLLGSSLSEIKAFVARTDAKGEVAAFWRLEELEGVVENKPSQLVRATLLRSDADAPAPPPDTAENYLDVPVLFGATFGVAWENQFGGSDFPDKQHKSLVVVTVEEALDQSRENTALHYVSGTGQEMPRGAARLPEPLVVRVANGQWPREGASVRFIVEQGGKLLAYDGGGSIAGTFTDVITDKHGLARVYWKPSDNNPPGPGGTGSPSQRVLAVLGAPTQLPAVLTDPLKKDPPSPGVAIFTAQLSLAAQTTYDGSAFPDDQHDGLKAETVEKALDQLRENTALHYVGGDGQEAYPGKQLPQSLQVRVANGQWPRQGAEVRFVASHGILQRGTTSATAPNPLSVPTDANGIAECRWTPAGTATAPGPLSQQATATLVSPSQFAGTPDTSIPGIVVFNAMLRRADETFYIANAESPSHTTIAQQAIDELYAMKVNRAGDVMTGALGINANLAVQRNVNIGYGSTKNADQSIAISEAAVPALVAVNGGLHVGGASDPGNDNLEVDGDCVIDGNCTIHGNLVVIKPPTDVERKQVVMEDNIIRVNAYDTAGLPPSTVLPLDVDAGLEVYRGGTELNPPLAAQLLWDEGEDRWKAGLKGALQPLAYGLGAERLTGGGFAEDLHRHSGLYRPGGAGTPVLTTDSQGTTLVSGGMLVQGNRSLSGLGDNLVFNGDWQFGLDGIAVFNNNGTLQIVGVNDSPAGGKALQVNGFMAFVMGDLLPFEQDALYIFDIVARQLSDPSIPGTKAIFFGAAGYLSDGQTPCNHTGAADLGNQHYVAVTGDALPQGWTRYTGYLRGTGATGTVSARPDPASPGVFHAAVRFFRPIVYINYAGGNGQALIASVRVRRLPSYATGEGEGVATGVVNFFDLPIGQEMQSTEIDPGLGAPAALCVQCGLDAEAPATTTTIADASLRNVAFWAVVNRITGRFRVFARGQGSATATARVRWWAIKPRSGAQTQDVAIQVSIDPTDVTLTPGATQVFIAMVSGTPNTAVGWTAIGGSISATGLYTAPADPGNYTVRATSAANPFQFATAAVTVIVPKKDFKDVQEGPIDKIVADGPDKIVADSPPTILSDSATKTLERTGPKSVESKAAPELIDSTVADRTLVGTATPIGRAFIAPEERPDLTRPAGAPDA